MRNYIFITVFLIFFGGVCFAVDANNIEQDKTAVVAVLEVNDVNVAENVIVPDIYINYEPVLDEYVENGLVDYAKLRRKRLELFPQMLEFENFAKDDYQKLSEDEKLAFWINAYNFFTISNVVQNYPIKSTPYSRIWWPADSVKQISKFYNETYFKVMGLEYTLDEIEKEMILQEFDRPEAVFALCKATLSSPPIRKEPYLAEKLNKQIKDQIKKYISNEFVFQYDNNENILYLPLEFEERSEFFIKKYSKIKSFRAFEPKVQAAFNCLTAYCDQETVDLLTGLSPEDITVNYKQVKWRYYTKINDITNIEN